MKEKMYIKQGTIEFYSVTAALFSAGLSNFAILYSVQPILPLFSKEFHLTPLQSSFSLSSSTIMMAIGMLFISPISDMYGRKIVMTGSLFLASIFTILCSIMNSWEGIIVIRILTGLSLSGVASIAMTYLSEEMHSSVLPFSIGLYISGNTIGGFIGRIMTSILSNIFSWNIALMFVGFFSLCGSILFLYLLPESKNFKYNLFVLNNLINNFMLQWKDSILSTLFIIGFILMGSFITIFNYIGYRLLVKPFCLNQGLIGFLSVVYLVGVYTSPKAGILIKNYGRISILNISLLIMFIGLLITEINYLLCVIIGLTCFAGGFFAAHSIVSSWVGHQSKLLRSYASSLYLFFYYLGSSIFGSIGGYFWFFGGWLGVSIFVISLLVISFLLIMNLKLILYTK
ncbi:Inner membrane transport protein YnfM [Buchnera aphidicola (Eriosoma lanigerum)]|uniref:MFS transporter n=1 Tax=Buchnera aphidicola TaxID=9 RepID=UPI003464A1D0